MHSADSINKSRMARADGSAGIGAADSVGSDMAKPLGVASPAIVRHRPASRHPDNSNAVAVRHSGRLSAAFAGYRLRDIALACMIVSP